MNSSYNHLDQKWNRVLIRFVDGHTVSVTIGNKYLGRYTYADFGMIDRRTGNPSTQWNLLKMFADHKGNLEKSSLRCWDTAVFKMQKHRLSKKLNNFFKLEHNPIFWNWQDRTYRCIFAISPEI